MFGLESLPFGAVDVIERSGEKMTAPSVAGFHNVERVVPSRIEGFGIDRGNGRFRTAAGILQFGPLCQAVLLPAEGPQRLTAPRQGSVGPEVGLGQVAAPILRQLLGQELGLGGIGYRMIFGAPVGFKVLHIVLVAGDDLGKLFIAPPSGKPFGGLFNENPISLLFALGGHVLQSDPAGWNGSGCDARQGHEHNYETRDTP